MKEFLEKVNAKNFKVSSTTNALQQSERNQLNRDFTLELIELLKKSLTDIDVVRTSNGVGINLPNEYQGAIPIELKIIVKSLDYDILEENENYNEKQEEKLKKTLEKQAKKQKAIKSKTSEN